jgi:hypothetical protein
MTTAPKPGRDQVAALAGVAAPLALTAILIPFRASDVLVDVKGQKTTHGIQEHIDAMKDMTGGSPAQITSHPIKFGSGDWTCVVGEFADGSRMVTVAKWRDGAIAEEYIWM